MARQVNIGFGSPWLIGSSRTFTVPVTDASGLSKSLAGASVVTWRMTDISPTEGTPTTLIEKTLGSGTAIAGTGSDEVEITVDEADTASLTPGIRYHELEVTDAAGDTERGVVYGPVKLTATAF